MKTRKYLPLLVSAFLAGLSVSPSFAAEQVVVPIPEQSSAIDTQASKIVDYHININTADSETLQEIKGIGKSKANAILEYRNENGPFNLVDDLAKVKGIGEQFLNSIREQITVSDE